MPSRGDFWLGLDKVHRITTSAKTTRKYQLVMEMKRANDGKWMKVVYENFYVDAPPHYHMRVGNVVERYETTIPDDPNANYINQRFGAKDTYTGWGDCPVKYKGGWWFNGCFFFCLNCDQRVHLLWFDGPKWANGVRLSETKMSIRIKMD